MATHNDIGLSQPAGSTTTHRLDAIQLDANSTVVLREVLVVGSPETTNALAAVLNATPASTAWALVVREAEPSTTVNVSSVAGVVTAQQNSTVWAVQVGGYSTTANVSSVAGVVNVQQNSTVWQVQQGGYVAPSTTVNVSSIAGPVIVRSSAADHLVTVYQSSAANLNVTVAGYSTTANISSIAGRVGVMPFSTAWASSAGFLFDSSGSLLVTGASASTQVAVSSLAGTVTVTPNGTTNSSVYFPVRITNGTAFLTLAQDYLHGSTLTASTVAGPLSMLRANSTIPPAVSTSDMFVAPWGTLHGAQVVAVVTSSGASVMDSTETAIKVNVVAGAAGGSTLVTVRQSTYTDFNTLSRLADRDASTAVVAIVNALQPASTAYGVVVRLPAPITDSTNSALRVNVVAGSAAGSTEVTVRQSTYTDFNTLSRIADRDQSTQVANVANTTPASTAWALTVREVVPQSTTVNVSSLAGAVIVRSSAASLLASVYQSTAADLNVTVAGYSTTVNVSSLAGAVIVRSSAADHLVTVYQSTAAALNATVVPGSTTWTVQSRATTSSGGSLEGSTNSPTHSVTGLHVRQALSSLQSTTVIVTSSNSTAVYSLIASVASVRHRVYAYYMGASTSGNNSTLVFMSSLAIDRWAVVFSSGVWGANLALSPPGYIFQTDAQNALNVRIESASTAVQARMSLAWFSEL